MKRFFTLLICLVFLGGCFSKNSKEDDSLNINPELIEKITISTQMTDPKEDLVIKNENFEKLINKLNSYSIKEIKDENEKGWQYLFKLEEKGGGIILISFMDDKVYVNEKAYQVEGYDKEDFLYLFDKYINK